MVVLKFEMVKFVRRWEEMECGACGYENGIVYDGDGYFVEYGGCRKFMKVGKFIDEKGNETVVYVCPECGTLRVKF